MKMPLLGIFYMEEAVKTPFFAGTSLKVQIVCTLRGDKYGKKLWMVLKRNNSPQKGMILIVKMKSYNLHKSCAQKLFVVKHFCSMKL